MQPDVSVIIAAHDAEDTIAEAICSALEQRDVSVEVIVADDASSDRTSRVAQSFPSDTVKVLTLAENRGPGGARNAAIAAATGRWIAVLDADDAMRADRLARMLARAQADDADIVVDNLSVAEGDGEGHAMFPAAMLESAGPLGLPAFIRSNQLFESRFNFGYMKPVLRRAFIAAHGLAYDETLRIGEDYIFLAGALAAGGRCAVEPGAGYLYRIRADSVSRVLEQRHVEAMLAADAAFARVNPLNAEATDALAERRRNLERAAAFLSLVDSLKRRALFKAAGTALRDPGALRHLAMPLGARLRRLAAPRPVRRDIATSEPT